VKPVQPPPYKNAIVALICLGAVALRFLLLHDQKLTVLGDERYDSRLFIDLAHAISQGNWLGAYDERTLIKGPFYPLWIASVHSLHLPLLKAQHALYVFASALAARAVARSLGATGALGFFLALLFDPTGFAAHTGMVLREYVNQSLAILIVACTLLAFWNTGERKSYRVGPLLWLGIFLSCFRLTREESVWILPFYAIAALHFCFRHARSLEKSWKSLCKNLGLVLLPFLFLAACVGAVSAINKARYGVWETVEVKSAFFLNAYGAVSRVPPAFFKQAVPVPREFRMHLYRVSPAFRELRPFLERDNSTWTCAILELKRAYAEGKLDEGSRRSIDFILKHDAAGVWRRAWDKADKEPCDIYGAWFLWAFREAVAQAGYYRSAVAARSYYERLFQEIQGACQEKKIPCGPHRASLAPPWRWDYLRPLASMFGRIIHLAVSLQGFAFDPPFSTGDAQSAVLFQQMTNEEPMPFRHDGSAPLKSWRTAFLKDIASLYQYIFPWVFYGAFLVHLALSLSFFKRVVGEPAWAFASAVLGSCGALTAILSYIHVTSFPGIEPRYLAPLHSMSVIYTVLVGLSAKALLGSQRKDQNDLDPRECGC